MDVEGNGREYFRLQWVENNLSLQVRYRKLVGIGRHTIPSSFVKGRWGRVGGEEEPLSGISMIIMSE